MYNFKLAAIRMHVHDVEKCRDWYKQFFQIDPFEDLKDFCAFDVDAIRFELCKADQKSPQSAGGSVAYFDVKNLEQSVKHAIGLGANIYRGPLNVNELGKTILQIKDPFGNIIGFESNFSGIEIVTK